jgi:broad specificity phosphatase PhoE
MQRVVRALLIARTLTSLKASSSFSSSTAITNSNDITCDSKKIVTGATVMMTTATNSTNNATTNIHASIKKRLLFLRHGQAMHNPRAEEAKDKGCSHETFLKLMQEDDAFDAPLTQLGISQATLASLSYKHKVKDVQLVVSSPLTRAIHTADLTIPPTSLQNRICIEDFREINGWLLNSKRRSKQDLIHIFHPHWDFNYLPSEQDDAWTETLESQENCAERCYQGMLWLKEREETNILTVAHGGLLRFAMVQHPNIIVVDGRKTQEQRFENCELREYDVEFTTNMDMLAEKQNEAHVDEDADTNNEENTGMTVKVTTERPLIILREIH